jgi:hypothetical protein
LTFDKKTWYHGHVTSKRGGTRKLLKDFKESLIETLELKNKQIMFDS